MITFEYTGYDAAGRSQKGMIEALDSKQAREKLIQAGILTEWLAPAGAQARRRGFRQPRFSLAQRAAFYRELASLLQAGLPLLAALELLIQAPDTGSLRPRLAHIRDKIREGASLSLALDATGELSTHERSILAAGEQAAVLDKVLERLADFMEEQQQLREKIITALIYPAILMLVALGIAIGLLGFAMPRLGLLLTEQTRVAIPGLTRLMIQAGHWVAFWGLPLLAAGALVAVAVWQRLRRDASFLRRIHQRALGLPIIGPGYAILINLRFARTLALLLHGGVSLIDGLVLAGQATGNSWVSAATQREAEAVRHGASLAEALRRIPPLAASLAGWVQVGEAAGALEHMLETAARRLQQQWDRFLTRRLALLEPALIILIGAFVLLVVLAIILPITALQQSLR